MLGSSREAFCSENLTIVMLISTTFLDNCLLLAGCSSLHTMHDLAIVVIEFSHERDMGLWVITIRWKQLLRPSQRWWWENDASPRWQSLVFSLQLWSQSSPLMRNQSQDVPSCPNVPGEGSQTARIMCQCIWWWLWPCLAGACVGLGHTTQIWATLVRTCRHKCGVSRFLKSRVAWG